MMFRTGADRTLRVVGPGPSSRARDVNRYVSQSLRSIRHARRLSQQQTCELLAAHSDSRWTVQAVSRAERCEGTYIKRWNVDDLYVLATAFAVPVSYFLPEPVTTAPRSWAGPAPDDEVDQCS